MFVGELDAGAAVGGAAGGHAGDGGEEAVFLVAGSGGEDEVGGAGVGDDGDAVFFVELFDEEAEAFFDEREFVGLVHGAGDIDEEDEVAVALFEADFFALDADAGEAVLGLPGAVGDFDVDGEGMGGVGGGGFEVVGEVVH